MRFRRTSDTAPVAVEIGASAIRSDRRAEAVTITQLSFDSCRISSDASFAVGERLRLQLPAQGWIEVEVEWMREGEAHLSFVVECKV